MRLKCGTLSTFSYRSVCSSGSCYKKIRRFFKMIELFWSSTCIILHDLSWPQLRNILPTKSPSSKNRFLCAAVTRPRSWLIAENGSQFKCTRSSRSSDQFYSYVSKWSAWIAQQQIDQMIWSMRAWLGEGVWKRYPLLIDIVELTRALHFNFEMKLLPLLLLKID